MFSLIVAMFIIFVIIRYLLKFSETTSAVLTVICLFSYKTFEQASAMGGASPITAIQAGAVGTIIVMGVILIYAWLSRVYKQQHNNEDTNDRLATKRQPLLLPAWTKHWIIPALLLALVVAAWAMRWDEQSTQNISEAKIVYKQDRWTGNSWAELYGISGKQFYAGKETPFTLTGKIATEKQSEIIWTKRKNMDKAGYAAIAFPLIWLFINIARTVSKKDSVQEDMHEQ